MSMKATGKQGGTTNERGRQLKDIMSDHVETIRPDADVQAAARMMKDLNVGAIPVCDGDRLLGMVTDRDITVRVVAEQRDPKSAKVQDAMTPEVIYGFEDQDLKEAAQLMQSKQIRRLPVLNRAKKLVGIVSLGDLALGAPDTHLTGEALKGVSQQGGQHQT
jgi:CBS domain-containing protein